MAQDQQRRAQQGQHRGAQQQARNQQGRVQQNRRPGQTQGSTRAGQPADGQRGGPTIHKTNAQQRNPRQQLVQDRARGNNIRHSTRDSNQQSKGANNGRNSDGSTRGPKGLAKSSYSLFRGSPEDVHKEAPKPLATVAMPSFLKAATSVPKQDVDSDGFGTGFAERKTLVYGERYEPEHEFVKQPEPPVREPEPSVAEDRPLAKDPEPPASAPGN